MLIVGVSGVVVVGLGVVVGGLGGIVIGLGVVVGGLGGIVVGLGVAVGGLGVDVGQVKFESLSIPEVLKVTKPGPLLPVMLLIQSWYLDTRV